MTGPEKCPTSRVGGGTGRRLNAVDPRKEFAEDLSCRKTYFTVLTRRITSDRRPVASSPFVGTCGDPCARCEDKVLFVPYLVVLFTFGIVMFEPHFETESVRHGRVDEQHLFG